MGLDQYMFVLSDCDKADLDKCETTEEIHQWFSNFYDNKTENCYWRKAYFLHDLVGEHDRATCLCDGEDDLYLLTFDQIKSILHYCIDCLCDHDELYNIHVTINQITDMLCQHENSSESYFLYYSSY